MIEKVELRKRHLEIRRALSPTVVHAAAQAVAARIASMAVIASSRQLLTYIASKDNEIETRPVVQWALERGKTVLVPVCMPGRALAWSVLRRMDRLAPTAFGVLEPREEEREFVDPMPDAPVLVPGIAFDERGYRIGYGAGYYDRFLARHDGPKIALAYECQLTREIPNEPHDVPMDMIVTESRVIVCKPE